MEFFPAERHLRARARVEQARASIVIVRAENESTRKVSQAVGFLIRSDLVATDIHVLNEGSRVRVTATKQSAIKVLSRGNYFLPYVLLEKQSEIAPLRLGDSEGVTVNDNVYMVGDQGPISAGTVTGTTTIKERSHVSDKSCNRLQQQRGVDFQPLWRSDGIAAESPNGHGAGLSFLLLYSLN